MNVKQIMNILNDKYPLRLSEEYCKKYDLHDNSGVLIDCGGHIKRALFTVDINQNALQYAENTGADMIITHHPLIYYPISNLRCDNPQGKILLRLIGGGRSLIALHLNGDIAKNGVDYNYMLALGGKKATATFQSLDGGYGYGRCFDVEARLFELYTEQVKDKIGAQRMSVYGDNKLIRRVACFCGGGLDNSAIEFALENGADAVACADVKHHEICKMLDSGLNIIQFTHYASENYGFKAIYNSVKDALNVHTDYYADESLL